MSEAWIWVAGMLLLPLSIVGASYTRIEVERLRRVATAVAAVMSGVSLLPLLMPGLLGFRWSPDWAWPAYFGTSWLRTSAFSAVLHLIPPVLWLLAVAVTPRLRLDRGGLRRTALATSTTAAAFLTEDPLLLLLCWVLSLAILRAALAAPEHRGARRVTMTYLWAASACFGVGLGLAVFGAEHPAWRSAGIVLMVAGALIRKGIFPFHAWVPEVFDRGRLGPAILFCAPQLGSYTTVVLIVPHAGSDLLRVIAILALVTAVYGAALALVQRDPRRACGYLFTSQSALVLAGLHGQSGQALAGSLVLWLSSSFAFAAFSRSVLVLEARRGRLDLNSHHGGYARMPMLAATFLLTGLACTGFPGTLGFVGVEMLVNGTVSRFPVLGFLVVIAGALTGLAVLRMYFSLFCGRPPESVSLGLLRREAITFAAVAIVLIVSGLVPGPVVASQLKAGDEIVRSLTREAAVRADGRAIAAPAAESTVATLPSPSWP